MPTKSTLRLSLMCCTPMASLAQSREERAYTLCQHLSSSSAAIPYTNHRQRLSWPEVWPALDLAATAWVGAVDMQSPATLAAVASLLAELLAARVAALAMVRPQARGPPRQVLAICPRQQPEIPAPHALGARTCGYRVRTPSAMEAELVS